MTQKAIISPEYAAFVGELKDRIRSARVSAARAVNRDLILLYWDIGRGILERQEKLGWGQSVVEMLARDLRRAFPEMKGFSAVNLWRMRQFYADHSTEEFLAQAARELNAPGDVGQKPILSQAVRELETELPGRKQDVNLSQALKGKLPSERELRAALQAEIKASPTSS